MIKKTGLGPPTPPSIRDTHGPASTGSVGFGVSVQGPKSSAAAAVGTAGAVAAPKTAAADPVASAVARVAGDVRAGRLAEPQARVDAVIEHIVTAQLGTGVDGKVLRERIGQVKLALGDHPDFSRRVHAMLDAEVARA